METLTGYHIPDDMIINILCRLPVKSLLRFRTVSKSWRSLISNPSFVDYHLRHAITSSENSELHMIHKVDNENFNSISLISHGDFNNEISYFKGQISSERRLYVVGSCNGIVCFVDVEYDCVYAKLSPNPIFRLLTSPKECQLFVYLWNPAIKQSKLLPPANPKKAAKTVDVSLGFGFDSVANDFKVVRIEHEYAGHIASAMVYSSNINVWKEIEPLPVNKYQRVNALCDVCVKGVLYWTSAFSVIRYDLNNEVFYYDSFPANALWFRNTWKFDVRIIEINNDSIGVIMFSYENMGNSRVELWTVDGGIKGPWILNCSFVVSRTVDWIHGYLNSSCDILFRTIDGKWWLYNPEEKKTEPAPVPLGTKKILKHCHSLVSIGESKQLGEMLTKTDLERLGETSEKAKC